MTDREEALVTGGLVLGFILGLLAAALLRTVM